jgi:hypothetical protein
MTSRLPMSPVFYPSAHTHPIHTGGAKRACARWQRGNPREAEDLRNYLAGSALTIQRTQTGPEPSRTEAPKKSPPSASLLRRLRSTRQAPARPPPHPNAEIQIGASYGLLPFRRDIGSHQDGVADLDLGVENCRDFGAMFGLGGLSECVITIWILPPRSSERSQVRCTALDFPPTDNPLSTVQRLGRPAENSPGLKVVVCLKKSR